MAYNACCLWTLGYPDQAAKLSSRALDLARKYNHAFTLADVINYAGCLFASLVGESEALSSYSNEFFALAEAHGFHGWMAAAECFKGVSIYLSGQPKEALAQIEKGIALSAVHGEYMHMPRIRYLIARLHSQLGDLSKAWENIDEAYKILESTGEHNWESMIYRGRAALHNLQGQYEDAESNLRKAIDIAHSQEAKSWELQAAFDLARLFQAQGRLAEARSVLSGVYSWFTEGFGTPDLIAARALLQSLS